MRYVPSPVAALLSLLLLATSCARDGRPPQPLPDHQPAPWQPSPQPYRPPASTESPRNGVLLGVFATTTDDDIRRTALAFLQTWLREDVEGLMELVSDDFALGAGSGGASGQIVREAWERQFARLDFTQFSLDEVIDRDRIEVIPFEQLVSQGTPPFSWLQPGDTMVRFRMLLTRRHQQRYFDEALEMWFRREAGRWKIVALGG